MCVVCVDLSSCFFLLFALLRCILSNVCYFLLRPRNKNVILSRQRFRCLGSGRTQRINRSAPPAPTSDNFTPAYALYGLAKPAYSVSRASNKKFSLSPRPFTHFPSFPSPSAFFQFLLPLTAPPFIKESFLPFDPCYSLSSPSSPTKTSYGVWERCKLPQRVRAEPGRQNHSGAFSSYERASWDDFLTRLHEGIARRGNGRLRSRWLRCDDRCGFGAQGRSGQLQAPASQPVIQSKQFSPPPRRLRFRRRPFAS